MSALRDLYVGITLDDRASNHLRLVDNRIDEIRDSFQNMNNDLDEVSIGFNQMGASGSRSMNQLEDASEDIEDAINDLTKAITSLSLVAEGAFNKMEDSADDVEDEIKDIGDQSERSMASVLMLGTALTAAFAGGVAASAPLVAGIGAISASLVGAGIGVAAFGAVAVGALSNVFKASEEIAKLEEKIANADSSKERIAAQKELAAVYKDMNKGQREAQEDLEGFKDFWGGFVKQFETPVFSAFSQGLGLVQNILTALSPTITNTGVVINEMLSRMNEAFSSGELKETFNWLSNQVGPSLGSFMISSGNLFQGMMNLFRAFAPLTSSIETGMVNMSRSFKEWSDGLGQSQGFQKFIEYAKTNGPVLLDTLGNIGGIVKDLVVGLAPLGSLVLSGLQKLTGFISDNVSPKFVEVGGIIGEFASSFSQTLLPVIQSFMPMVNERMGLFKQIGLSLFETFQNIFPTLQDIFNTVFPIAINLFTKVSSVINSLIKEVVLPLLPKIGTILSEVWGVVKPILGPLNGLFSAVADTVSWLIKDVVSPLIPVVSMTLSKMWEKTKPILDGMVSVFTTIVDIVSFAIEGFNKFASVAKNFKMPKIGLPKFMGGKGLIQTDGSHATGLARVPRDGYIGELHKDESVLTAKQSTALRQAGILKTNGNGTPSLEMGDNPVNGSPSGNAPNITNTFYITVQGGNDVAASVKKVVEQVLDESYKNLISIYSPGVEL